MKQSAKHNKKYSLFNKPYLKKIDMLVFELSEFKQTIRQTTILKSLKMFLCRGGNPEWSKICLNIEITK
jgi:hypothetical protein